MQLQYVGKDLKEIPTPAAVLDLAPIRRNCKAMLEATKALGQALAERADILRELVPLIHLGVLCGVQRWRIRCENECLI